MRGKHISIALDVEVGAVVALELSSLATNDLGQRQMARRTGCRKTSYDLGEKSNDLYSLHTMADKSYQ